MNRPGGRQNGLVLFAIFTAIGAFNFGYRYFDDLARNIPHTALPRAIEEFTGAYAALVLFPFIMWVVRRYGFGCRFTWPLALGAQILGMVVYSVAHTTLMAVSRAIIFPLVHLGPYDYGNMLFRYPMEASNDVISFALMAGAIYFFDHLDRARATELAAADLRRKLAEAQLDNLRLQLQPHFLFNTLNAISSVMYEDVDRADAMLAKLSAFLRAILASSDARAVSLRDEIEIERMYVEIMTGRLESALAFDAHLDPDSAGAAVPPMILQPIVENAIRHGMPGGRNALRIAVSGTRTNGRIEVRVDDDGVGIAADARPDGRGLENVRSRLAQLYDNDYTFELAPNTDGGTAARLSFPYRAVAERAS